MPLHRLDWQSRCDKYFKEQKPYRTQRDLGLRPLRNELFDHNGDKYWDPVILEKAWEPDVLTFGATHLRKLQGLSRCVSAISDQAKFEQLFFVCL
jgi:hypothetical protein